MSCFRADENTAKEIFEIVCEEVERLHESNPVQYPLRNIQIVYLKRRHLEKQKTAPPFRRNPSLVAQCTRNEYAYSRRFGSVSVVLKEGEITTCKADAIINILPNRLQVPSDNSVCETILKATRQTVQANLNRHTRSNHTRSIFTTNAESIKNVEKILHIIPESTGGPDLQSSLEQCLDFVKTLSLSNVLIPVAETMSLEVSLSCLVKLILAAAENCSIHGSVITLEIAVLVERSEFDNLKLLFDKVPITADPLQDTSGRRHMDDISIVASDDNDGDAFVNQKIANPLVVSPSYGPKGISETGKEAHINISANKRDEDEILLHVVGLQPDVSESISEVTDFVDQNKATKSIQISNDGSQFCQRHIKDLEQFSCVYHVMMYLQTGEITIEGITKNVLDCYDEIIRFLAKYERNKEEIKRPPEEFIKGNRFSSDEVRSDVDNTAVVTNICKDRGDTGEEFERDSKCFP